MQHVDLAQTAVSEARAREIRESVQRAQERVRQAAERAKRPAESVRLLAATKTRTVGEIIAALEAGITLIGENRTQELVAKREALTAQCAEHSIAMPECHLIGQLQPNKINKTLPLADVIESVDSLGLAEKIAKRTVARGERIGVLLEVNESGESTKSGCKPGLAVNIAEQIGAIGGIELLGLMTIGAHTSDERRIRDGFERLRRTRDLILASGLPGTQHCTELSMGMSADFELAIAEGATIVRLGTAIFGARAFI